MSSVWALPERYLVTELAVGIARRLASILGDGDHVGPGYVHHIYMSAFETACSVLWRLGVAHAAYGPEPGRNGLPLHTPPFSEGIFPPFFKFLAPSEIREALAGDPPTSSPSLHEIICAYLGVACDYGVSESQLSSRREPFVPPEEYIREIDALEHSGYVDRHGSAVLWTDRISPAMREIYAWTADGQSQAEVAEVAFATSVAAALDETPEVAKRVLALEARHLTELEFWAFARNRYPELSWVNNPLGMPQAGFLGLLKAVYRALRKNEGSSHD